MEFENPSYLMNFDDLYVYVYVYVSMCECIG